MLIEVRFPTIVATLLERNELHPKYDFFILIQNNSGISYGEPQATI